MMELLSFSHRCSTLMRKYEAENNMFDFEVDKMILVPITSAVSDS
jgi:hypothetical protein